MFNYIIARIMNNSRNNKRKLLLVSAIIFNCSGLVVFKYFDFFIETINGIFKTEHSFLSLALPIGISFYTFQSLSYIIDVYKNKIEPQTNIFDLGLYLSFFANILAGPIVRYNEVQNELQNRKITSANLTEGLRRFIFGLAKKVLIANNLSLIVDGLYANANLSDLGTIWLWVAAISYTLHIYYDFSGYSDMAIGIAKIFGFVFPENFNYPYLSKSISEFWRRWHISLSTWFKDYIYIPLGGNRVKPILWIRNVSIVWLLTGLWHGARWNFIIWGIYFGILLVLEKTVISKIQIKVPKLLKWLATIILVIFGWLIFRLENIDSIMSAVTTMVIYTPMKMSGDLVYSYNIIVSCVIIPIALIGCTPKIRELGIGFFEKNSITRIISHLVVIAMFALCIAQLLSSTYNPFVYFKF